MFSALESKCIQAFLRNACPTAIAVYMRIVMRLPASKLEPDAHNRYATALPKCIQAPLWAACPTAIAVYTRIVMRLPASKLTSAAHTPLCTSQCFVRITGGKTSGGRLLCPDRSEAETLNKVSRSPSV